MILFLSSWHLVSVLGVFLGFSALLGVSGILWAAFAALEHRQDEETVKLERRSAAAKRGHATRRAKAAEPDIFEDEVERVLRQIDQQAEAKR